MKHNYAITTLQRRTIDTSLVLVNPTTLTEFAALELIANKAINALVETYPNIFKASEKQLYLAYALSKLAIIAIRTGNINVIDYIAFLANEKEHNEKAINDFGAFGDLFEILVRIAFLRNIQLINFRHISVHTFGKLDLQSKKYGNVEIGHNGKTLQEATPDNFMNGNYDTFVYGIFDNYTKELVYNACKQKDILGALKIIKAYTIICPKTDFIPTLQKYRRGAIVAIKSGKVMIQYNDSLYKCVLQAIENSDFQTLETL